MRRASASIPLLAVALALGASCNSVRGTSEVQSLEASLDPLQARFNDEKGKLRFIALLSPT